MIWIIIGLVLLSLTAYLAYWAGQMEAGQHGYLSGWLAGYSAGQRVQTRRLTALYRIVEATDHTLEAQPHKWAKPISTN